MRPRHALTHTGKKRLIRSSADTLRMAAPFILWGVAVAAVYGITIAKLRGVRGAAMCFVRVMRGGGVQAHSR